MNDLLAQLESQVNSNVSRVVAFALTPILTTAAGAGAYWIQNVVGVDLQKHVAVAVGFVVAVAGGTALAILKWIENRGLFEKAAVELIHLYHLGTGQPDGPPPPPVPPGT